MAEFKTAKLDSNNKIPVEFIPASVGAVQSVAGKTGAVTLTKSDVGFTLSALFNGTDETSTLQSAVNAAAGSILTLPANKTIKSQKITIPPAGVTIRGESQTATIDYIDPGTTGATLFEALDGSNFFVEDLTIFSSNASGRTSAWGHLRTRGWTNFAVRRVKFGKSSSCAIWMSTTNNFILDDIDIDGTYADGIHVSRGSSHGTISRIRGKNTGDDLVGLNSYMSDGATNYSQMVDITVSDIRGQNIGTGRGVAVNGVKDAFVRDITIDGVAQAAVIVSRDGNMFTPENVLVDGVSASNTGLNVPNGGTSGAVYVAHLVRGSVVNVRGADTTVAIAASASNVGRENNHIHTTAQVSGLDAALAGKANTSVVANRLLGTDSSAAQATFQYASTAVNSSIAQRTATGQLIAADPTTGTHVVTKSVSDAALALKADLVSGKIPSSQIPSLALTEPIVVASQTEMLALTSAQVQQGDLAIRTDGAGTFILSGSDPSVLSNWVLLNSPTDVVTSVAGRQGAVTLAKSDVGLGNVDNTSDANKPVSSATQAALDVKATIPAGTSQVAATGGTAGVQSNISYTANATANTIAFRTSTGTLNVAAPTSDAHATTKLYTDTALNLKAPLASPAFTGTPTGITKTHVGLGNVDNTSDANKPVSTATQTALNSKVSSSNATVSDIVVVSSLPATGVAKTLYLKPVTV